VPQFEQNPHLDLISILHFGQVFLFSLLLFSPLTGSVIVISTGLFSISIFSSICCVSVLSGICCSFSLASCSCFSLASRSCFSLASRSCFSLASRSCLSFICDKFISSKAFAYSISENSNSTISGFYCRTLFLISF